MRIANHESRIAGGAAGLALLALALGCGKAGAPGAAAAAPAGEMALLPAGEFTMGDPSGRPDETPHRVKIDAFYIDRTPVTQELFERVMGRNPSKRKEAKAPVDRIQWIDAVTFCNRLSEREGRRPCYDPNTGECDFEADGYRLPTEAEWEYACRAGSSGRYGFGDDPAKLGPHAWFKDNSQGRTHPVGRKAANAWGLFDLHGNVWEWCHDWYDEGYYRQSPAANPRGPATGKQRVLRGGAWESDAEKCRAAYRHKEFPVFTDACFGADSYGFRRVRSARPSKAAAGPAPAPTPAPAPAPEVKPTATALQGKGKIDPARLKGTIVFVSDRAGALDVWRMKANGQDPKPLTKDAHADADPRFSPDGRRILFTTLRGGFPEVWVMARDGSGPTKVTGGSQGAWSPDGGSIVFIRDNQAWVRELAGGRERRLTPEGWERCGVPAWSPDGKRIAVASRHEEAIAIYLLNPDGKDPVKLRTQEPSCTPAWFKDGTKLLCQTTKGHVHQVGVDGSNWEQLTFGADVQHDGRYSPDGTLLLFTRAPTPEGPWQICVADLESDDLDFVQLTKDGSNSLPDWHPSEE
jgi:formylglycine-generating enzyme required for sulfatase activity